MAEQKEELCQCVECRVRRAVLGGDQDAVVEVNEVLNGLAPLVAEMLAHHNEDCAALYFDRILSMRAEWLGHPRVRLQSLPAQGSA